MSRWPAVVVMVIGFSLFNSLMIFSNPMAYAATVYVDNSYGNDFPGTGTAIDPFHQIQDGINQAIAGDTVEVAAGTFTGSIYMKNGVSIQGAGIDVSIIDKNFSSVAVFNHNVNGEASLDGFTITRGQSTTDLGGGGMYNSFSSPRISNCRFHNNSATQGGGMSNESSSPMISDCIFDGNQATHETGGGMHNYSSSSPTLINCTFSGNTALKGGCGMYNTSSSPTVTNCTFSGNYTTASYGGGGMYNASSSPIVTNCTFSDNAVNGFGGGMYNASSSTPTVTNCTFSANTAGSSGGGMCNSSSSPTVSNCIFSGNHTPVYGGGMYNFSSSPTVINCTFSGNLRGITGGAIKNDSSSAPIVTNCILWGDQPPEISNDSSSPIVTYSNIEGGYTGTGNINATPLFVNEANGNLHLRPSSPCIDSGDNSPSALPTNDIDGDDRKIDDAGVLDTGNGTTPIVDMGADEFSGVSIYGDVNGDSQVELLDAILALQIPSGFSAYGSNIGADVDDDLIIGIVEAIYILQKVGSVR